MSLSDLEHKFLEELSQLTIDDFYADEDILKKIFLSLTGLSAEENIEAQVEDFLKGYFNEKAFSEEDDECLSLNFFLKTLLGKSIAIRPVKASRLVTKVSFRSMMEYEAQEEYETGEVKLQIGEIERFQEHSDEEEIANEQGSLLRPLFKNVIPDNWSNIVVEALSKPLYRMQGKFVVMDAKKSVLTGTRINKQGLEYDSIDKAALLALKKSVKSEEMLITGDNEIYLSAFNGIAATISLREKGKYSKKTQKMGTEIYGIVYGYNDYERFRDMELTSQSGGISKERGYGSHHYDVVHSANLIKCPIGYYIVTEEHIIDIRFSSAPLLMR